MQANYRKNLTIQVQEINLGSPQPSGYIPHQFVKSPKYKKAIYFEEEIPIKKSLSPKRSQNNAQTQTGSTQTAFKLQKSNSFAPGFPETPFQNIPFKSDFKSDKMGKPPLPKLQKQDSVSSQVQLELLQSRNPHDSKKLGLMNNNSFATKPKTLQSNYFSSAELVTVPEYEICYEAGLKRQWTINQWEHVNGKKLNQIISDEY
ncbi:Hypothetical_protein [Hexamita inflata]|uniref:Hypothetical_protein n=1 Tax=Hexamita inflata TaxID=28002 RepID=A0AA86R8X3_9EUKA|nr:Hypothetical protein HINF_LOCUS22466 [Hexamita inflata]CAI9957657.1 Hypothetical protein HINF_LOCUS45302 [Hexamita inflata]CAI9963710.1 Hypothetical protein HINF_LOCUS51355 [Hexamita inflata]CAI9964558.1 Hypothetical protein HINF_LOCUS52203 [Hexamita inflata]